MPRKAKSMSGEIEISLKSGDGGVVLSSHPSPDDVRKVGSIIDLFTPTSSTDRLGPATPDEGGDIIREADPTLTLAHIEQTLAVLGCTVL